MKKLISGILAALMVGGMLTVGAVAETADTALKFDDTVCAEGGGSSGYTHIPTDILGGALDGVGLAISMEFTMGHKGPCYHPVDATMYHSSKFNICLGQSDGEFKYFGYNATEDFFYLAHSYNGVNGGETTDGYDYYAVSDHGLVNNGVAYELTFMTDFETGFKAFLDGECILQFDMYDDLVVPTVWAYDYLLLYPTHICCYVDDFAVYNYDAFDFETGAFIGEPEYTEDFEGAESMEDIGWGIQDPLAYSLVDPADEIYGQPNYNPGDAPNLIFRDDADSTSDLDFTVDLTMANNPGFDAIEFDLMQDELITVVSVEAAEGYTAALDGAHLTITGNGCTNEKLATITYHMAEEAIQDYYYGYGVDFDTVEGIDGLIVTGGQTTVYNYTVGDVNGDGKYTLIDVSWIMKNSAKWDLPKGMFKESMDVNSDGRVNNMDASYYLRHLAGWKDYLPMPAPKK